MINAFFFIIKASIVAAFAIWIAEHPGSVTIEWMSTSFKIHSGFAMIVLIVLMLLAIFIYDALVSIKNLPKNYRSFRTLKEQEKSYIALTKGLSAVAAGDLKNARREAKKAQKPFIKNKTEPDALVLLLQAQVARMEGKTDVARETFERLLKSKNGRFLGIRGLLQEALSKHDYKKAQVLIEQALTINPTNHWIIETAYNVYLIQEQWDNARKTLKKGVKAGVFTATKQKDDLAGLYVAEATQHLESKRIEKAIRILLKARKIASDFLPASLMLAHIYTDQERKKALRHLIQKVWQETPHPDLAHLWMKAITKRGTKTPAGEMAWAEKLVVLNPNAVESHILAARIAIKQNLWGAAQSYIEKALNIRPDRTAYNLMQDIKSNLGKDENQLSDANEYKNLSDMGWICIKTGQVFQNWTARTKMYGHFNCIKWQEHKPDNILPNTGQLSATTDYIISQLPSGC